MFRHAYMNLKAPTFMYIAGSYWTYVSLRGLGVVVEAHCEERSWVDNTIAGTER